MEESATVALNRLSAAADYRLSAMAGYRLPKQVLKKKLPKPYKTLTRPLTLGRC